MDTTPGRVGGERTGRKERKGENLQTGASVGGRGRGDILGGAETTRRQTTMHRREWREDGEQTGESIQTTTTISQPRTHARTPTHGAGLSVPSSIVPNAFPCHACSRGTTAYLICGNLQSNKSNQSAGSAAHWSHSTPGHVLSRLQARHELRASDCRRLSHRTSQ